MPNRLRKSLGIAAATVIAAAGLAALPVEHAAAGAGCETKAGNVPVRVAPVTGSGVVKVLPRRGTDLDCGSVPGKPDWWRVSDPTTGNYLGYVGKRFIDASAG